MRFERLSLMMLIKLWFTSRHGMFYCKTHKSKYESVSKLVVKNGVTYIIEIKKMK